MGRKVVIGISQGDTNGIGYEIIIKALADARILDMCTPIVYGSSKAFGFYKKQLPAVESMHTNIINTAADVQNRRVNIINCVPDNLQLDPGQPTEDGSRAAVIALEAAVEDLKSGLIDALVTAPFNKRGVASVGFNYDSTRSHTLSNSQTVGSVEGFLFEKKVKDLLTGFGYGMMSSDMKLLAGVFLYRMLFFEFMKAFCVLILP